MATTRGVRNPDESTAPPAKKILFARAWMRLKNNWLAVDEAGYECKDNRSRSSLAWELHQDDEVRAEMKRLQKLMEKNYVMSVAEIDKSVADLNNANLADLVDPETGEVKELKDIPRSLSHAIAEYTSETTIDKEGNKHVKRKVKLHNKKEVAELIMRRKNLLKGAGDGSEVRVRFTFGKGGGVKGKRE